MNRRSFLKASAGAVTAAFIVPELIIPERRFWSLDRTMMPDRLPVIYYGNLGFARPANAEEAFKYMSRQGVIAVGDLRPGDMYAHEGSGTVWLQTKGSGFIVASNLSSMAAHEKRDGRAYITRLWPKH